MNLIWSYFLRNVESVLMAVFTLCVVCFVSIRFDRKSERSGAIDTNTRNETKRNRRSEERRREEKRGNSNHCTSRQYKYFFFLFELKSLYGLGLFWMFCEWEIRQMSIEHELMITFNNFSTQKPTFSNEKQVVIKYPFGINFYFRFDIFRRYILNMGTHNTHTRTQIHGLHRQAAIH